MPQWEFTGWGRDHKIKWKRIARVSRYRHTELLVPLDFIAVPLHYTHPYSWDPLIFLEQGSPTQVSWCMEVSHANFCSSPLPSTRKDGPSRTRSCCPPREPRKAQTPTRHRLSCINAAARVRVCFLASCHRFVAASIFLFSCHNLELPLLWSVRGKKG